MQQRRRRRLALSHTKSGRSVAAAAASVASVPVGGRGRSVGRWGPQFVRLGCTMPFARSLKTGLLEELATGLVMTKPIRLQMRPPKLLPNLQLCSTIGWDDATGHRRRRPPFGPIGENRGKEEQHFAKDAPRPSSPEMEPKIIIIIPSNPDIRSKPTEEGVVKGTGARASKTRGGAVNMRRGKKRTRPLGISRLG